MRQCSLQKKRPWGTFLARPREDEEEEEGDEALLLPAQVQPPARAASTCMPNSTSSCPANDPAYRPVKGGPRGRPSRAPTFEAGALTPCARSFPGSQSRLPQVGPDMERAYMRTKNAYNAGHAARAESAA